jgi:hypothetical protein
VPIIVLPEVDSGYVTIPEIRALPNLGDITKFTDAELADARDWFETIFERHTGMAFVPRTATERLDGRYATIMLKHWPVIAVTAVRSYTSATGYTAFTVDELADLKVDPTGEIKRYAAGAWPGDVELDYIHGQAAPPADIKDAALVAIRQKLLRDQSGDRGNRQYGVAQEGVFVRNVQGPFFNDEVNGIADAYRDAYKLPGMA